MNSSQLPPGLYIGDKIKMSKVFIKRAPYDLNEALLNVRVKEIITHEDGTKEIWFQKEA
jgi:hypothetical protein